MPLPFAAKDLPIIHEKIYEALFLQMVLEGMNVTHEQVREIVGNICFLSTDADRSALGHINQTLFAIEGYISGEIYKGFDQINALINTCPYSLDGAGKYSNLSTPLAEMRKIVGQHIGPVREMPIHSISLN